MSLILYADQGRLELPLRLGPAVFTICGSLLQGHPLAGAIGNMCRAGAQHYTYFAGSIVIYNQPMHKKDIANRKDIELLINGFYAKVRQDEELGIIFNEVVQMDWPHHIPIIVDFWETVLLNADLYHKNAMEPHFAINKLYPLQHNHFQKWLQLFFHTLDEYFEGPITTLAKTRAMGVAGIMEIKMNKINHPHNELDIKKL